MSLIKKIFLNVIILILCFSASAEEIKKIGKFKDWETMVLVDDSGVICFAQSKPILQAPKKNKREARLFVSFRPNEKITNEISTTPGYEFNQQNSITAKSGKYKYNFDPCIWLVYSFYPFQFAHEFQEGASNKCTFVSL